MKMITVLSTGNLVCLSFSTIQDGDPNPPYERKCAFDVVRRRRVLSKLCDVIYIIWRLCENKDNFFNV